MLSGLVGTALAQGLAAGRRRHSARRPWAARPTSRRGGVPPARLRPMDVVAALPDLWREWELLRLAPPLPRPPVLLELEAPQAV